MKQTKKTKKSFFSFEKIGDKVEGVLNGFSTSQYGLVADIGNNLVSINKTQLLSIFRDNRKEFKTGKKIKITFVDEKKVKKQKNKVKIFTVIFDGKELLAESTFEVKTNLLDKSFDILFEK